LSSITPISSSDGIGGHLLRHAGLHPDDARHVHVPGLGVDDVAEDDVIDVIGRDTGALEGRAGGRRAEIARRHAGEALAVGADRGASGRSDNDVGHFVLSGGWRARGAE
jgi:hypothetical protein